MPLSIRYGGLLLLGIIVGCGDDLSTSKPVVVLEHEGTVVAFPDGKGYLEYVKKQGKSPISAEVSFYFYNRDKTPCNPESASLTVVGNKKLPLQVDGEALVTPEGPVLFADRNVEGVISFELENEDYRIRLGQR